MRALVSRHGRGDYSVVIPTPNTQGRVCVVFSLMGADKQWQLFNHKGTEINCWTSKRSMIEYLEDQTEDKLIILNDQ